MFNTRSSLPDDLLERLKQYDVKIVPLERSQEPQPRCARIPEGNGPNDESMGYPILYDAESEFRGFEKVNTFDFYRRDPTTRNYFQPENRNEYESTFGASLTSGIRSPVPTQRHMTSRDDEVIFDGWSNSHEMFQESTPRKKIRTEESNSPPLQHYLTNGRFHKVICSKLMGRDTDIQPKPRKRLRFDDVTSGNLPDPSHSCINRNRPLENVRHENEGYVDQTFITKCSRCHNNTEQYRSHLPNENLLSVRFRQVPSTIQHRDTKITSNQQKQTGSMCACAAMRQYFVKMAERAFGNIRRKDSTPGGFSQFMVEINTTNVLLRQTLTILTSIRNMCDHVART